jgi:hypothetical protein
VKRGIYPSTAIPTVMRIKESEKVVSLIKKRSVIKRRPEMSSSRKKIVLLLSSVFSESLAIVLARP